MTSAGHVFAAALAHAAHRSRLRTDTVVYNWKGLDFLEIFSLADDADCLQSVAFVV